MPFYTLFKRQIAGGTNTTNIHSKFQITLKLEI